MGKLIRAGYRPYKKKNDLIKLNIHCIKAGIPRESGIKKYRVIDGKKVPMGNDERLNEYFPSPR